MKSMTNPKQKDQLSKLSTTKLQVPNITKRKERRHNRIQQLEPDQEKICGNRYSRKLQLLLVSGTKCFFRKNCWKTLFNKTEHLHIMPK